MKFKEGRASFILSDIAAELNCNGFDNPALDARHLLAMALGRIDPVLPHETITINNDARNKLAVLILRRNLGEPIARIRGYREFYSIAFCLDASTLDPRSDSEVLVDTALDWLAKSDCKNPYLLDLGTGSGCLLLSVLANAATARGVGVDIQQEAVLMARRNAKTLNLSSRAEFLTSIWDEKLEDEGHQFNLILCNPPYIPASDIAGLMDEVRLYDPMIALDGGKDGLDEWRKLAPIIARRLAPRLDNDAAACVEIGQGQCADVTAIFNAAGLRLAEKRTDLTGIVRCLRFVKA